MELSMSRLPVGPWLFGKMPSQGDFVSRGLDLPFREGLDQWLSGGMEAARGERAGSGADFEERYVGAPAWNFVDRDPDGCWAGGALCASVDRVGRLFPLVMGAPAADADEAAGLSSACVSALHDAFAQGWDADRLCAAVLCPADPPWNPKGPEWVLLGEDGPAVVLRERFPAGIVRTMLEIAL